MNNETTLAWVLIYLVAIAGLMMLVDWSLEKKLDALIQVQSDSRAILSEGRDMLNLGYCLEYPNDKDCK